MIGSDFNFENAELSGEFSKDIAFFKKVFLKDSILRIREMSVGKEFLKCAVLYFDGMVSSASIYESVLKPLASLRNDGEMSEKMWQKSQSVCAQSQSVGESTQSIDAQSQSADEISQSADEISQSADENPKSADKTAQSRGVHPQSADEIPQSVDKTAQNNDGSWICDFLMERILCCDSVLKTNNLSEMISGMQSGDTVLLIDGSKSTLLINTKGFEKRGISEPGDERILQGPREGFCESAMVNLSLLRRKLSTHDLCIETTKVGVRTFTSVYVCYLGNLASRKMVKRIKIALDKIDIDGILDTNYLAEIFTKGKNRLFKMFGNTERPDVAAARLLEGRVCIIVDGSPVALTMPYLFTENFQSDEDYYQDYLSASVGRILRYICFFLSFSVPAIYLALTVYHKRLLPTAFLLAISAAREGVPFSSLVECMLLIVVFEILKEAGLRTQQSFGQALSIVGGLVVGQAAVEAKIVSTPMLIAVALSGIAGLMVPRLRTQVLYLRFIFIFAAAGFGLFGYFSAMCALIAKISSLKSFGEDQTPSLIVPSFRRMKDTVIRAPIPFMKHRPSFNQNSVRMGTFEDMDSTDSDKIYEKIQGEDENEDENEKDEM